MDLFKSDYTNQNGRGLLNYKPPKEFKHGLPELVAEFPKTPKNGDGQNVEIWETRMPARFYTIKALPTRNSIGELQPSFALSTGSSQEKLVNDIATAISEGMLGLEREE